MVSKQAKERVKNIVALGIHENLFSRWSELRLKDYPKGHWVGATLFDEVTPDMALYQEEIFGPVLSCLQVDSLDHAISIVNDNPFGNGTAIFTESGAAARQYQQEIMVGQAGINALILYAALFFIYRMENSFLVINTPMASKRFIFIQKRKRSHQCWLDKTNQKNMSISL